MPKRTVDDIVAEIPTRAMMPPGQESRVDRALRTLDPDHAAALRKVLADEINYSAIAIAKWLTSIGHPMGYQPIGKWRRDHRPDR